MHVIKKVLYIMLQKNQIWTLDFYSTFTCNIDEFSSAVLEKKIFSQAHLE